jgi:DNA-binding PadR family transcriptional regulator
MQTEKEEKTTANWIKEAQKGYIRMGVLILLNKKPSHGYEIMKEINNRTKGFWQPTAGGVYPILRDLEKSGYVRGRWEKQKNRRLKVYTITESGELILRRAIVKEAEIFNNIGSLFQEFARDVLNIETITIMPMPHPLTAFLKETSSEENLKQLEHERNHAYEACKMMQKKLKVIDKRIREIKKQTNNDSPSEPHKEPASVNN